jgi:hypothetical protein
MAIDTAAKRLSIMDMDESTMPGMPAPDGAITQGDRQHFLWLYSGILAAGGATAFPWIYYQMQRNR